MSKKAARAMSPDIDNIILTSKQSERKEKKKDDFENFFKNKNKITESSTSFDKFIKLWKVIEAKYSEEKLIELIKKQYIVKNLLGSGTYGTVYKVTIDSTEWAVKNLNPGKSHNLHELNIMFGLRHPCLMFAVGMIFYNDSNVSIIMPVATETLNLENLKFSDKDGTEYYNQYNYSIDEKIEICYKILSGVDFLHKKNYIHMDIRDMNVFVFKDKKGNLDVKVGDFSLSIFGFSELAPHIHYTIPVVYPPESKKKIGIFTDIYMMGVMFYIITFSYFPDYEKDKDKFIDEKIVDWEKFLDFETDELKNIDDKNEVKFKKQMIKMLRNMFNPDYLKRSTILDLYKDKIFSKIDYYFDGFTVSTRVNISQKESSKAIKCYEETMRLYSRQLKNIKSTAICSAIRLMLRFIKENVKFNDDSTFIDEDLLILCITIVESDIRTWKRFMDLFKEVDDSLYPTVLNLCYISKGLINDFYAKSNEHICGQLLKNFPKNIDVFISNKKVDK